jgi:hypothetical protein
MTLLKKKLNLSEETFEDTEKIKKATKAFLYLLHLPSFMLKKLLVTLFS